MRALREEAMKRSLLFLAGLLLLFAGSARADILLLKNGGRVEGVVTERGDFYVVENVAGTAELKKNQVAARVKAPYVTQQYEKRLAAIPPHDVKARFDLALWCRSHGLRERARKNLEVVVRLDPDHARARALLGYVHRFGKWMTKEEARRARLTAAGLVERDGKWMTAAARAIRERARREVVELKKKEAAKQAALQAEKEKKAKEEAAKRAREAALARAAEQRRERARLEQENEDLRWLVRELLRRESLDLLGGYGWAWPLGVYVPGTRVSAPLRFGRAVRRGIPFRWTWGRFTVRGRVR